ncbi:MAG: BTAD domain-containing putative transcriptional regulator [Armatimonadota bacterium]|nr:BTAD domain-containing putative transcriptional regulator [Armatimonadota bacterium]MDR5697348.1 BTAD domain-containing putative transcriptional regulator [Armatimonadota bacterium]
MDVDVTRVLGGSAQGRGHPVASAVGELLAGMDYADCDELDEWMLAERERVRQAQRAALECEADRFEADGDFNAALATAQVLLEMEPVSEAAHRRIMRLHYLNNDRPAALQAYHRCQAILRQTLCVDPLPETVALARQIERGTVLPGTAGRRSPIPPGAAPTAGAGRPRAGVGADGSRVERR